MRDGKADIAIDGFVPFLLGHSYLSMQNLSANTMSSGHGVDLAPKENSNSTAADSLYEINVTQNPSVCCSEQNLLQLVSEIHMHKPEPEPLPPRKLSLNLNDSVFHIFGYRDRFQQWELFLELRLKGFSADIDWFFSFHDIISMCEGVIQQAQRR